MSVNNIAPGFNNTYHPSSQNNLLSQDQVDVFDLSNKYNIILIFDCPSKENTSYQNFSQSILNNLNEVLILFLDTEIPPQFKRQLHQLHRQSSSSNIPTSKPFNSANNVIQNERSTSHSGSQNNLVQFERNNSISHSSSSHQLSLAPQNIIQTYDSALAWLLIGIFSSQSNKQIQIFTDQVDFFKQKLQTQTYERRLKTNIFIQPCSEVTTFSLEDALNPWLQFDNSEVLSNFEIEQLQLILKKFIKQVVSSKHPHNLEKLINIAQNLSNNYKIIYIFFLVKAHLSSIQRSEKFRVHSDLAFHFVRSLFLENVLENDIILSAILTNRVQSLSDFESFSNINYTEKFQSIIDKIQKSIQDKKMQAQRALNEQNAKEGTQKQASGSDGTGEGKERKMTGEEEENGVEVSEERVVFHAVQSLLDQYLHLFHKGKIFEIKKLLKLVKQIQNYVVGFIKKNETAPQNSKVKVHVEILEKSTRLISINILRVITQHNLIKQIDINQIEHDAQKVQELVSQPQYFLKHLKESDLIFNQEQANSIFEQPSLIFKKEKEETKLDNLALEQLQTKKDPTDIIIEKLYHQMKASKHYPNSLRELERLIKKHIVKKGEVTGAVLGIIAAQTGVSTGGQAQTTGSLIGLDEDRTVELVMKRMNERGMFTQKNRTGESKEHAKDPKLRNIDIIEQYRREKKDDIAIVFESSIIQPTGLSTTSSANMNSSSTTKGTHHNSQQIQQQQTQSQHSSNQT